MPAVDRSVGLICADSDYYRESARREERRGRRRSAIVAAAIVVLLGISSLAVVLGAPHQRIRGSISVFVPHDTIAIHSDAEFDTMAASEGWPGSGTLSSPYIISGYEISADMRTYAFYVENTNTYFILRNCYFHDAASAVYLYFSSNAVIENNTIENCNMGFISYAGSATVANNIISRCNYGTYDVSSAGITYSGNTLTDNVMGITLIMSDGNIITGNVLSNSSYAGVVLANSQLTMARNNQFSHDGFMISGSSVEYWNTQDIDTSNTVNGLPVLYYADTLGGTISAEYGQIILANCSGTVVDSQSISNTSIGVMAGFCTKTFVQNSKFENNLAGVMYDFSDTVSVQLCSFADNYVGIEVSDSFDCFVDNNTFTGDTEGIYLGYCSGFVISSNTITSDLIAILLEGSEYGTLILNVMSMSGILMQGDLVEYWNTHAIDTSNTVNSYPVIYMKNVIGEPVPYGAGQIIFANCAQLIISGSYPDHATAGFQLGFTSGCRVTTLAATNGIYGVKLYSSPGNQIDNAVCDNNEYGIYVEESEMCTVTTNFLHYNTVAAIALVNSPTQTLSLNSMTQNGIRILGDDVSAWNTHTLGGSNFVNGLPVYYNKDATGLNISSGYGQVILANCVNSVINAQTIVNASAAVQLGFCSFVTVYNLTASENNYAAFLESSDHCALVGLWLTNNFYGVYMQNSVYNSVANSLFFRSASYAVYLGQWCMYNRVWNNTFQYNNGAGDVYDMTHVQACDDGDYNWWNSTDRGNYWQDWLTPDMDMNGIVDVPYELRGFGGAKDYYPLTTATQVIPELGPMMLAATVAVISGIVFGVRRKK